MSWFTRKLDTLIGAVFAGIGGAVCSQFDAFVLQYLQRLGGHIDEARRNLSLVIDPDRLRELSGEARAALVADARVRVNDLEAAYQAITRSDLVTKPWAFVANLDAEIAGRTLDAFRPVVPVDLAGLVYAALGLALGLIAYEIVKAPFALFGRPRNPRRIAR